MKRLITIVTTIILIFATCAGCVSGDTTTSTTTTSESTTSATTTEPEPDYPDIVYLGAVQPLTGPNADSGLQALNATQLAVKHINEQGGVKSLGGAKIELVIVDITSDAGQAAQIMERTLAANNLSGIAGAPSSPITMAFLPVTERYGVPVLTTGTNIAITTSGNSYVFQPAPNATEFGKQQVNLIKYFDEEYKLGYKTVAIVYENSAYGMSTAENSAKIAENAGLEVVMYEPFNALASDMSPLVTAMKNSNADILLPSAFTQDAVLMVNTMKSMNYNPIIIASGGGFVLPYLAQAMGPASDGLLAVGSWNWDQKNVVDDPKLKAVTEAFEEEYGYFLTEIGGPSYAFICLLKEAMENCGSADPTDIRDALLANEFKGTLLGDVKFNENGGNVNAVPVVIQWKDSYPRAIFPPELATNKMMIPGIDY